MSVNGVSTVNVTHGQAVEALKRAGNVVSLVSAFRYVTLHFVAVLQRPSPWRHLASRFILLYALTKSCKTSSPLYVSFTVRTTDVLSTEGQRRY
jgi:hypothetical protein